jgi:UDP-N-acetylglucosamine 2-epimerase (non-hydrolysing)
LRIAIVAGARPNFMKIAPIIDALKAVNRQGRDGVDFTVIHTGQHYDENMSNSFFRDLQLPAPDINLGVGSGTHAVQTAEIMKKFEEVCGRHRFSHALVVGDVNSTIACALVGAKLGIKVVHVEAGLRSFDRSMPEEINRVLTDAISDLLFTTEQSACDNLVREGVDPMKIHFVGNVMIDTLLKHRDKASASQVLSRLGLEHASDYPYGVLTLHRPSNVDDPSSLESIIAAASVTARQFPIVFPVHPRTAPRIAQPGAQHSLTWIHNGARIPRQGRGIFCTEPLGYLDFLRLMSSARLVLTDSGGIQEETTILRVPCVTIRENTERPVTVTHGTNRLASTSPQAIIQASTMALAQDYSSLPPPPLWDGKAAERIVRILIKSR